MYQGSVNPLISNPFSGISETSARFQGLQRSIKPNDNRHLPLNAHVRSGFTEGNTIVSQDFCGTGALVYFNSTNIYKNYLIYVTSNLYMI